MRGWFGLAILLILLSPAAAAQTCKVTAGGYTAEYACPSGDPEKDAPWYLKNETQLALAVIGLVGSASAGGYAIWRVRSRRQTLTKTLLAIESTYIQAKSDPENGIARLSDVRANVRANHDKGKLDDAHFLELDKRATDYLVKLRMLEIDRKICHPSPVFLAEIRRLLADGVLTPSEADLIEVRASVHRIGEPARSQLAELARRWAADDAPRLAVEAPSA